MKQLMSFISTLTEGARIEHPEDLVFTEGSAGALRAVAELEKLAQDPASQISIKWDGSPAVIFGRRPADGKFTLNYKEWIKKPGGQVTTPQELTQFIQSRGGDKSGLIQKLLEFWPTAEAAVPAGFQGFVWGDLLYTGVPAVQQGKYVFKPNTVTYSVVANSQLGKRIASSSAGVAVHQYLSDVDSEPQMLKGTGGLNVNGPLLVLTGETPLPKIKLNIPQFKQAQAWISQHAAVIDDFLNPANLSGMRSINELMKRYINSRVRTGDLSNLTNGWLAWVGTAGGSQQQSQRMLEYSQAHDDGLVGIFGSFVIITQLKMGIKQQMDAAQAQSSVQANPGHEGYVTGQGDNKLKLVDRLEFSRLNFAKNA
jgi:hypothetical protein